MSHLEFPTRATSRLVRSILLTATVAWTTASAGNPDNRTWPEHPDAETRLAEIALALEGTSPPAAILVGEVHDQLSYHINQLAVITSLRNQGHKVAIGLEMVHVPFQQALDDFVDGSIDFEEMLARVEYFDRWRYDVRLYQPIFAYARAHGLPLRALNAPSELTQRVREVGIEGLNEEERRLFPEPPIALAPKYRARLESVFSEHRELSSSDFQRFVDVQLVWDEVMAWQATKFLESNPDHVLVVLAGVQHAAKGQGIPRRIANHSRAQVLVVLSEAEREWDPESADIFLGLPSASLPEPGLMGVMIRPDESGALVDGFADDSQAERAGMERNDRIVEIDGRAIETFQDIKLALWNRGAGDRVEVSVIREGQGHVRMSFSLQ